MWSIVLCATPFEENIFSLGVRYNFKSESNYISAKVGVSHTMHIHITSHENGIREQSKQLNFKWSDQFSFEEYLNKTQEVCALLPEISGAAKENIDRTWLNQIEIIMDTYEVEYVHSWYVIIATSTDNIVQHFSWKSVRNDGEK